MRDCITVAEAAKNLTLFSERVRQLSNAGILRPIRIGPRGMRVFCHAEVVQLAARRREARSPIPVGGGRR